MPSDETFQTLGRRVGGDGRWSSMGEKACVVYRIGPLPVVESPTVTHHEYSCSVDRFDTMFLSPLFSSSVMRHDRPSSPTMSRGRHGRKSSIYTESDRDDRGERMYSMTPRLHTSYKCLFRLDRSYALLGLLRVPRRFFRLSHTFFPSETVSPACWLAVCRERVRRLHEWFGSRCPGKENGD